jgi:hypothetical protein
MVYAVAMKVIEGARRALGRPITFYRSPSRPKLRLLPHAFYGANAFFDPKLNAICFGYFRANPAAPGPNLPSQTVYTCLSHDIVAHEVTHAIVHRLRPYFLEPTNVDVLAFHEAFSDVVALFQRFSYRDLLIDHIQTSRGRLAESKMLIELAQQFGYATGSGKALRSAIGVEPSPTNLSKTVEALQTDDKTPQEQFDALDPLDGSDEGARQLRNKMYASLHTYAEMNRTLLGLDSTKAVAVSGFHAVHRVGADQRLVVELVAQFTQTHESPRAQLGGLRFRAGATVIFGSEGEVRYIAAKPMPAVNLPQELQQLAKSRIAATERYVADLDLRDPRMALPDDEYIKQRMTLRAQFRALHEGG